MKWKEKFDKEFTDNNLRDDLSEQKVANYIKSFISAEIIEKLIEDIPTAVIQSLNSIETDYGVITSNQLKQQLRAKWLTNPKLSPQDERELWRRLEARLKPDDEGLSRVRPSHLVTWCPKCENHTFWLHYKDIGGDMYYWQECPKCGYKET